MSIPVYSVTSGLSLTTSDFLFVSPPLFVDVVSVERRTIAHHHGSNVKNSAYEEEEMCFFHFDDSLARPTSLPFYPPAALGEDVNKFIRYISARDMARIKEFFFHESARRDNETTKNTGR